jgi:hypothetical protein
LRNYPRVRFGFSRTDNIIATNTTSMKKRKPTPKNRKNNAQKKGGAAKTITGVICIFRDL